MLSLFAILPPALAALFVLSSRTEYTTKIRSYVPVAAVGISFIAASILFYTLLSGPVLTIIDLGTWFSIGTFQVNISILIDSLSVVMLFVITSISFLVHIYSLEYMSHDPELPSFMGHLSLFTFFMLLLVSAGNMLQMFIGWEGVGLSSYFLINFWKTRIAANKAAIKALLVNKIGDFFLMVAMGALAFSFNSLDYHVLFALASSIDINTIDFFFLQFVHPLDFCCLLILGGAVAKSAQIGLHTWLPDAMEGPSPVSALLHAATMVTAGIFILCRSSPILELSPLTLSLCVIVGSLTAFFAASAGFFQNDIKRVIALSTCSQLGYMLFACGLSGYNFAMFHLFNHAFFKALLFLSAGSVIHALADEQDMRRMGGLLNILPLSYTATLIGSLSLAGFPFLTGFYSKDGILELAYASYSSVGYFAFILGTISAFLTAFYSFRLIYLTYYTRPNTTHATLLHVHDAPLKMAIPLVVLVFASVFVGYIFKDLFVGPNTDVWGNSLFFHPQHTARVYTEYVPTYIKLLPVFASLSGIAMSYLVLTNGSFVAFNFTSLGHNVYFFLNNKWYFDVLYNYFFVRPALYLGQRVFQEIVDKGTLELFGPAGVIKVVLYISNALSTLHSGYLYHYTFLFLLGLFIPLLPVFMPQIVLEITDILN